MSRKPLLPLLICGCFCLMSAFTQETDQEKDKRMQWFADAKLGILSKSVPGYYFTNFQAAIGIGGLPRNW
jgi:hypothetical protein